MSRLQLFPKELSRDSLKQIAESDPAFFEKTGDKIIDRVFTVGNAKLSRRVLSHWAAEGLLPYDDGKEGWTKFSFIEFCWIKVIQELRSIDISLKQIKELKNQLFKFDLAIMIEMIDYARNQHAEFSEVEKGLAETKLNLLSMQQDTGKWNKLKNEMQLSEFSIYLLHIILEGHNLCLVIQKGSHYNTIILGDYLPEWKETNDEALKGLLNESFLLINLRKIVYSVISADTGKFVPDYRIAFLNIRERKLLDFIRSGDYSEINIQLDDSGKLILLKLSKNKITNEILNKLITFLKKGNFKEVEFRTRENKILKYKETDIFNFE
jgi:DNA-binding transcriptional MerR regulator